jgi:hypothetical protein
MIVCHSDLACLEDAALYAVSSRSAGSARGFAEEHGFETSYYDNPAATSTPVVGTPITGHMFDWVPLSGQPGRPSASFAPIAVGPGVRSLRNARHFRVS